MDDITGKIGPFPGRYEGTRAPEWPMYSFAGPSCSVWQGIADGLAQQGKTEEQIKDILQSKFMRWELDGTLTEQLRQFGVVYAWVHGKNWNVPPEGV